MPSDYRFENNFKIRSGLLLVAEIGLVSCVAACGLLTVALVRAIKQYRQLGPDEGYLQPVSVLFLVAIFMDALEALGSVLSSKWAFDGTVTLGSYCTAQSVLKQLGNDGVALSTIAIAVLTWVQVMYPGAIHPTNSRLVTVSVIGFIGLFLLLMVGVPAIVVDNYYGDTGLWCWITSDTKTGSIMRIASEYAWLWLAALVSFVLYGWIAVRWIHEAGTELDRRLVQDAIMMGWYPIAYFVEIFPLSLVRFLSFRSNRPDQGWVILVSVLFASSGTVNVLLWLITGRRFGFQPLHKRHSRDSELDNLREVYNSPVTDQPSFPPPAAEGTAYEPYGTAAPYQWTSVRQ